MRMKLDTKTGLLMIVAVVVLALILLYAFTRMPALAPSGPSTASGPTPTYAAHGTLIAGFPQALVMDASSTVGTSYSINYAGTGDQYTAQWDSSSPVASVFNNYLDYFTKNGWTITSQTTVSPDVRGVYATNASSSANIAIMAITNGSRVTVSYLQQ